MKTRALFIALMAVALAACNNTMQPEQQASTSNAATTTTQEQPQDIDLITPQGIGDFQLGSTIPDTHPDYTFKEVSIIDEEDMEELFYEVHKDGKLMFIIHPSLIDESCAYDDKIGQIAVFSNQYSYKGNRVGDNINDILKNNPGLKTTYFYDNNFRVTDGGITYYVDGNDYEGQLPEVPFDIPTPVDHPTFKPDAKVASIWISPAMD